MIIRFLLNSISEHAIIAPTVQIICWTQLIPFVLIYFDAFIAG